MASLPFATLREAHEDMQELVYQYFTAPEDMEYLVAGLKLNLASPARLNPHDCPRFANPAKIQVINQDPLDHAVYIRSRMPPDPLPGGQQRQIRGDVLPVLVNAVAFRTGEQADQPNGGFPTAVGRGAAARRQNPRLENWVDSGTWHAEKEMCIRSSLCVDLSRNQAEYPISGPLPVSPPRGATTRAKAASRSAAGGQQVAHAQHQAQVQPLCSHITAEVIHSPRVAVLRESLINNLTLYDDADIQSWRTTISVISVAPIQFGLAREINRGQFPLTAQQIRRNRQRHPQRRGGPLSATVSVFARDDARNFTKDKMRLILRVAARQRHRDLVLTALGAHETNHPVEDVAHCWLEVFKETEFQGNWWRTVTFAIYSPRDDAGFTGTTKRERNPSYEVFYNVLEGEFV